MVPEYWSEAKDYLINSDALLGNIIKKYSHAKLISHKNPFVTLVKSIVGQQISVKVADRPGGYIRIIKLGNRQGDNAAMAMVELVDYNEIYNPNSKKTKKTTRRGRSKKADGAQVEETVTEEKSEE